MQNIKTLSAMIGQNVEIQRLSHRGNSRRVVCAGIISDVSEIRSADGLATVGAVVVFADGQRVRLSKSAERRRLVAAKPSILGLKNTFGKFDEK
jgi:hypothetical protein